MPRILFLADINSAHTRKWTEGLVSKGFTVGIFSISAPNDDWYKKFPQVETFNDFQLPKKWMEGSSLVKIYYLASLRNLKPAIRYFKPDIIHAHYASSYGLLCALSGFHPSILSVWGSDVFDFPNASAFHKKVFMFNCRKADRILSTSKVMRDETLKYTSQPVDITPFGVDTDLFSPSNSFLNTNQFTIGIIKSLEKKYGLDVLIDAFSFFVNKRPEADLRLIIVGSGSLENELKEKVKKLKLENKVEFTGKIPQDKVPQYHNKFDVFCSLSVDDSESFGVSTVEAMACAKPVIVSAVGGLKEVVVNNECGFVVEPCNAIAAAEAMDKLFLYPELRDKLGQAARKRVLDEYKWENNLDKMIGIYQKVMRIESKATS